MVKIVGETKLAYNDVKYDEEGWADANHYLPEACDLVCMKLARNKTINGWHTGSKWFGIRLLHDDKVLSWQKAKEVY